MDHIQGKHESAINIILVGLVFTIICTQNVHSEPPTPSSMTLAATKGDVKTLSQLIKSGGSVNIPDGKGRTPLVSAISSKNPEAVKLLLESGAKIDRSGLYGVTPMDLAMSIGNKEIVELLLKHGANPNTPSALKTALVSGNSDVARLLISYGAKCPHDVLMFAVSGNDPAMVEMLLSRGYNAHVKQDDGGTLLHMAAAKQSVRIVQLLLNHKLGVNDKSVYQQTPLHAAAFGGSGEVVKLLLDSGANPDISDYEGNTPLWFAVGKGSYESAVLLIEHGADLKHRNSDGFRVVHAAAEGGNPKIMEYLIQNGVDIHEIAGDGSTPLHLAVLAPTPYMIEYLLSKGAQRDVNVRDAKGKTPVMIAKIIGNNEREKILTGKISRASDQTVTNHDITQFQNEKEMLDRSRSTILSKLLNPSPVMELDLQSLNKSQTLLIIPGLIEAIRHEELLVRQKAIDVLGEIGAVEAVDALIEILGDRKGSKTIQEVTADPVSALFEKPNQLLKAKIRSSAALALGKIGDRRAVPALIDALEHDEWTRTDAAISLGVLKDVTAVQPLIRALDDKASDVASAAANALGKIGDKSAVLPLIRAAKHTDFDVRSSAEAALKAMDIKSDSTQIGQDISVLSETKKQNTNNADKYNEQGNAYYRSKQHKKAIYEYNKAIAVAPNFAAAYYNRGNAYASLNKFEQAKKDLLKAVELDPMLKPNVKKSSVVYKLNLKLD